MIKIGMAGATDFFSNFFSLEIIPEGYSSCNFLVVQPNLVSSFSSARKFNEKVKLFSYFAFLSALILLGVTFSTHSLTLL